ncbi:MAG: ABC transporter substrate-binding protein [Patescibacteria group bacterium]
MTNFLNKETLVSFKQKVVSAINSFSIKETALFFFLSVVFLASLAGIIWKVSDSFMIPVPASGGEITEGVIGAPRFINPLLAISDADRDIAALVYSGLLRGSSDGSLIPDLASKYDVSEDGRIYTFTIRDDAYFHNGDKVTADDVIFTILKAQDSALKSPKRANWEGVSVEKINDQEVKFTLKQAYSPFLENATLGILPKNVWKEAGSEQFSFSEFNVLPIGSGPYKINKVKKNSSGVPSYYELSSFKKFVLGAPYINKIIIRFYPNEEALFNAYKKKEIEGINAIPPDFAISLKNDGVRIESAPLPRIFGIFWNQNQANIFTDKAVRQALDILVDKDAIIEKVIHGYGVKIEGPIPKGGIGYESVQEKSLSAEERIGGAKKILTTGGWKFNDKTSRWEKKVKKETRVLEFSISTGEAPELKDAAQVVKENWAMAGIKVEVKVFETGDLNQNVIRPRKYDALLFGEIIGRDSDPFAFWHSSQRLDPGLNIALYTNIKADKLLEEARTTNDTAKRAEKYSLFQKEVRSDVPAIFLYSPEFIYVVPEKINGLEVGFITVPSERFLDVYKWFVETNKVWKIFAKN